MSFNMKIGKAVIMATLCLYMLVRLQEVETAPRASPYSAIDLENDALCRKFLKPRASRACNSTIKAIG